MELPPDLVAKAVAVFEEYIAQDDEAMYYLLEDAGIEPTLCNRVIQFVPMVFTRYLFQAGGVRFADDYRTIDRAGHVSDPLKFVDNPVFRAVWEWCDSQPADSWQKEVRTAIAARSGGYQAIIAANAAGQALHQIMVGQPILMK